MDLCLGLFVWNFVFEETIHNVSQFLIHNAPSFLTQIEILTYIMKSLVLFDLLFPASHALVNSPDSLGTSQDAPSSSVMFRVLTSLELRICDVRPTTLVLKGSSDLTTLDSTFFSCFLLIR